MRQAVLLCALTMGTLSCSSSASSTFSAGLPPAQVVNTLGPSEVVRVCERAERFFVSMFDVPELERLYCTYGGVNAVLLGVPTTCDAFVDGCLETPPLVIQPVTAGSYDCDNLTPADLAACESTIGEIEDCLNQIAANYEALRGLLTCGLVQDPNWMQQITDALELISASSCASLDPDCPFAPDTGPTLP